MGEDLEASFKRYLCIVPQVKQAYEEAIGQVFADLSPSDLRAFSAIIAEHEDSILDTEKLVNTMRTQMTTILANVTRNFFDGNDIENKLVTLEVLKAKFAPYEGKDWNSMTPEELTRPLRVRLLDSSIRFMERHLQAQEKELEIAMAKSKANRERLQSVQNERVKLTAKMEQQTTQYEEIRPQLLELKLSMHNSFLPPEN